MHRPRLAPLCCGTTRPSSHNPLTRDLRLNTRIVRLRLPASAGPDGQLVRIGSMLSGDNAFHFRVDVAQDGLNMTVSHALDEEWLGECLLDAHSEVMTLDEYSTQLRVVMTPVNDLL